MNEGTQQQARHAKTFHGYVEELRRQKIEAISRADKITRVLDYLEKHPDCEEFLRLAEEMQ
jgi:hypothetical protein